MALRALVLALEIQSRRRRIRCRLFRKSSRRNTRGITLRLPAGTIELIDAYARYVNGDRAYGEGAPRPSAGGIVKARLHAKALVQDFLDGCAP